MENNFGYVGSQHNQCLDWLISKKAQFDFGSESSGGKRTFELSFSVNELAFEWVKRRFTVPKKFAVNVEFALLGSYLLNGNGCQLVNKLFEMSPVFNSYYSRLIELLEVPSDTNLETLTARIKAYEQNLLEESDFNDFDYNEKDTLLMGTSTALESIQYWKRVADNPESPWRNWAGLIVPTPRPGFEYKEWPDWAKADVEGAVVGGITGAYVGLGVGAIPGAIAGGAVSSATNILFKAYVW